MLLMRYRIRAPKPLRSVDIIHDTRLGMNRGIECERVANGSRLLLIHALTSFEGVMPRCSAAMLAAHATSSS